MKAIFDKLYLIKIKNFSAENAIRRITRETKTEKRYL